MGRGVRSMRKNKKGIVGIEAAIVLIAFVIVAAALAFVALNMGLFTTQKSKEVISRGLGEASSALEVDGAVTGLTDGSKVYAVSIPVKVAPGREAVDVSPDKTTVRLIAASNAFENIHKLVLYCKYDESLKAYKLYYASNRSVIENVTTNLELKNLTNTIWGSVLSPLGSGSVPQAVIVIVKNVNDDSVLEYGEKAILLINMKDTNYELLPYDKVVVEIRPPEGAPLTVERTMPATLPSSGGAIDLG